MFIPFRVHPQPLSSSQATFACSFTHITTHTYTHTHNYTHQLFLFVFFFFHSIFLMSLLSPRAPPLALMLSLVGSTCVRLSVACNRGDSVSLANFLVFYCLTSCNDLSLVLHMLRHRVTAACGRKDSTVKLNNLCPVLQHLYWGVLHRLKLKWRLSGDISVSQWGWSCRWIWLKTKLWLLLE